MSEVLLPVSIGLTVCIIALQLYIIRSHFRHMRYHLDLLEKGKHDV